MSLEYDTLIEVRVGKDRITSVKPAVAIVTRQGVTWDVVGLSARYAVEIDFRVQGTKKGPFGAARPRGRYLARKDGPIRSHESDQKGGVWKYDVILRNADGVDVHAIDPSIIIRE